MKRSQFNTRTDLQILNAGDFAKIGRKSYRHESGIEITFDCNKSGYRVSNQPGYIYPNLHSAVSQVRYREDWEWVGMHMAQRISGISERRAREYAKRLGGKAQCLNGELI